MARPEWAVGDESTHSCGATKTDQRFNPWLTASRSNARFPLPPWRRWS